MYEALGIILALAGVIGAFLYAQAKAKKEGRTEKEHETQGEILDKVKKANAASADSSHDDELRKKYGR